MGAGIAPIENARRWVWIPLIWVGLGLAGVFLLRSDYGLPANASAPPPLHTALKVEEWNNKLRLNWDPAAEALRAASRAEVEITDGDRQARIALSPAAVRNGNITYAPHNADIGFRLLAEDGSGWKASESIWYIGRAEAPAVDTRRDVSKIWPLHHKQEGQE